ncbi:hypothetical protein CAEBREN_02172 [Caenorhabditis brenneri]|uniref:Uncharacterized protein n=1 Tax=Caenorhabditis brenneri TaxID=135651 RepID=G0MBF2_CAEBE|nr:hypothetical protein CAEBREN_02172 [Caenorhabditis brenneri]
MSYTWVTSKDVCDAARAVLTKDDSNLKRKGARIQLLDKLFKTTFLNYCRWKSAEEAKQELTAQGQKRKRGEASDGSKSKKAKSWSDIDSASSDSSSDSKSESDSSFPYSSDDDEHKQEEQQIDTSQFAEKTAIDDSLVIADTNSPTSAYSSRIDKDTTFYYNADDEAELDEEIGW